MIWVGGIVGISLFSPCSSDTLGATSEDSSDKLGATSEDSAFPVHTGLMTVPMKRETIHALSSGSICLQISTMLTTQAWDVGLDATSCCCSLSVLGPMASAGRSRNLIPLLFELPTTSGYSGTMWRGGSRGIWEDLMVLIGTMGS